MQTIIYILYCIAILITSSLFMVNVISIAKNYFKDILNYRYLVILCFINGANILILICLVIKLIINFYL